MIKISTINKFKSHFKVKTIDLNACDGKEVEFREDYNSGADMLKRLKIGNWLVLNNDEHSPVMRETIQSHARKLGLRVTIIVHPNIPAWLIGRLE